MPNFLLRKSTGELEIVSGTEPFTVTPGSGVGQYDIYRLDNGATVTLEGEPVVDTDPPNLSGFSIQLDANQAVLSWTSDEASGTAFWVCTTTVTTPSVAQIKAGLNASGGDAEASGQVPVQAGGAQTAPAVDGLVDGETYSFHLVQEDPAGNASAVLSGTVSLPAVDTTAPVLSGVQAVLSGTQARLLWSSDEASGAGYWVLTTSAIAPSATQILAGQTNSGETATASGIQAVSAVGVQPEQAVSGLAPGTYHFHLIQRDASGNISPRVSTTGLTVANSDGVSAAINIFNRSEHQLAPECVSMEISVTGFETPGPAGGQVYNPQYHELYYFWDFGDDYAFSAPTNLIEQHKAAGTGYGAKVSHTFRAPGTYAVTCRVIEPSTGLSTTASISVTVADPEEVFAGLNTIFVSPSSDWSNEQPGARRMTNLNDALGSIQGSQTGPKRIMLNRGEVFTFSGREYGNAGSGSSLPSTHIVAASGDGSKPVVNMNGMFLWRDNGTSGSGYDKDLVVQGIEFRGPWNSVTETGGNQTAFFIWDNSPRQFLVDDCGFDGFDIALYLEGQEDMRAFYAVNDCSITNWRSYGILYGGGEGLAVLGSQVACDPQAAVGGDQNGQHNNQGPLRISRGNKVIITNCDFFTRTGWTGGPQFRHIQPAVRNNVSGQPGYFSNIQCSSFEGGYAVLDWSPQGGDTAPAVNSIVEKCYILGNHQTWAPVNTRMAGLTVRNNIIVYPNASRAAGPNNPFSFMQTQTAPGTNPPEGQSAPIRFYNNTCVNLLAPENFGGTVSAYAGSPAFTDVRASNNLLHQPNIGVAPDAPVESTTVLWIPREDGYRSYVQPLMPETATPHDTVASYRPQTGSAALGDALNGDVSYDDFFGNERPQYPSRGAQEA